MEHEGFNEDLFGKDKLRELKSLSPKELEVEIGYVYATISF